MDKSFAGLLTVIILIGLTLTSCNDDEAPIIEEFESHSNQVFLINEGNFQWGNASLGAYLPDSNIYNSELFSKANGYPLGDVFQSFTAWGGFYYLVLNNSAKILQIDTSNLLVQGEISGFTSPRYLLPLSEEEALVSDLYSNKISLVNLNNRSVVEQVNFNGWSEQMVKVEDLVYVGNRSNDYLYVLKTSPLELIDSIKLEHQVHSMVLDYHNNLWAICQGDAVKKLKGGLFCIDTKSNNILKSYEFTENDYPFNLRINPTKDSLFYLNKNIYKLAVDGGILPGQLIIETGSTTPYGLDIEPSTGSIYYSDAKDYVKKSTIHIYNSGTGKEIQNFEAGVLCNGFYFKK